MINIDNFMNEIYYPLMDHSGVDQLVKANQKVPPEQLQNNRIVYNMILFANTGARHTIIQSTKVIESEDPEFENDIEIENIFFPEATLSFTGFNNIMVPINKIREWFYVHGLGDWWLRDNGYNCVIRDVMEIEDRTVYLESDYEKRYGFDVILEFKDVVKVTYETIESIEVTGTDGETENIDI
ncbi:MAG: hypothetical protein FH762_17375 [Firmicutes bacterium]|nr:hypothetical protein [Bacillota bacterium]